MQYPPQGSPQYPVARPPAARSWSNGKILGVIAGVGCLGALAIGALIAVFVVAIMGSLKKSDAYREAKQVFVSSPVVVADLGTPVRDGWLPSGSINVSGPSGNADLTFSLSGPKGEGSAHAVAARSAGVWRVLVADWSFGGKVTPLVSAPASSSALPAP